METIGDGLELHMVGVWNWGLGSAQNIQFWNMFWNLLELIAFLNVYYMATPNGWLCHEIISISTISIIWKKSIFLISVIKRICNCIFLSKPIENNIKVNLSLNTYLMILLLDLYLFGLLFWIASFILFSSTRSLET